MPGNGTNVSIGIQGDLELAKRLVEYVVLTHDPAVPLAAADYWKHSAGHYRAVARIAEELVRADPDAARAYRAVVDDPDAGRHEIRLVEALAALLGRDGSRVVEVERTLAQADEQVYVRYHLGSDYEPDTPEVELAEAVAVPRLHRPSPRPVGAGEPLVVIALRDRSGGARVRNLLACVAALRDQSADEATIAVVEVDSEPRWQHLVAPVVDQYLFAPSQGAFNRSWALNVGVSHAAGDAPYVCVMDADILVDRDFVARNAARLRDGTHDAHIPFEILTAMDAPASSHAIRRRFAQGGPAVSMTQIRALLLRDVAGACLWARREFYERLGGHDERYEGWGGEDDDFLIRMRDAGEVLRYDDRLLHMAHPRPAMVDADGRPFNEHIEPGTWTAAHGFGRLTGPVRPASAGRDAA